MLVIVRINKWLFIGQPLRLVGLFFCMMVQKDTTLIYAYVQMVNERISQGISIDI